MSLLIYSSTLLAVVLLNFTQSIQSDLLNQTKLNFLQTLKMFSVDVILQHTNLCLACSLVSCDPVRQLGSVPVIIQTSHKVHILKSN